MEKERKIVDKLMKDWKSSSNRLEYYESLYELNSESSDEFIKNSIEFYRKEIQSIREALKSFTQIEGK